MALLDFLRKKKKREKRKKEPAKKTAKEKKPGEKQKRPSKKREGAKAHVPRVKKRAYKDAYRILLSPHITEKATGLSEKDKYVFRVGRSANKSEIKKAVEQVYGVDVIGVKIINVKRKRRRLGRQRGWRTGYKKAVVVIKEGQKIEVIPR